MDKQAVFLVSSLSKIFPPMTEDEYARLEESIRESGLLEEITLWRGTVIDGFHRLRACLRLGVEPRFFFLPDGRQSSGLCYRQERLAPGPGSLAAAHRSLQGLGVVTGGTPAQFWGKLRKFAQFPDPGPGRLPLRRQQALGYRSRESTGPGKPGDTGAAKGRPLGADHRQRRGPRP